MRHPKEKDADDGKHSGREIDGEQEDRYTAYNEK